MVDQTYTVVLLRERDGGYSVSVPALKGCHTQGDDVPQALQMVEDAIRLFIESLHAHGKPVPADVATVAFDLLDRQSGAHVVLWHPERELSVSVPVHGGADLRAGTLRGIIRDAGLTVAEFRRLLDRR